MKEAAQKAVDSMNGVIAAHLQVTDYLRGQVEGERDLKNKYKQDADELGQKLMFEQEKNFHLNERLDWMSAQIGSLKKELQIAHSVTRELSQQPTPPITPPPASLEEEKEVIVEIDPIEEDNERNKRTREELEEDHPASVTHYKRAHHKTVAEEPKTPREALSQAVAETIQHSRGQRMARMAVEDKIAPPKNQKVKRTVSKFDLLK